MSSTAESERFVLLTSPHLLAMRRAATALLGEHDAEDAAQEAIVRAWQSWSMLRDDRAVRSWLLRITINVCREWYRLHYRKLMRQTSSLTEQADELPVPLTLPPGSTDHADVLDLRQAVNDLPADLRVIVILRYFIGLDSTELGAVLDLPSATVRTRLRRALKMMRIELDLSSTNAAITVQGPTGKRLT
jgi:RNA polymerase sigma factor (sigma-70 family)